MDKKTQLEFIHDLIESVEDDLIRDLNQIPDGWDGAELREWIADRFAQQKTNTLIRDRKRLRAYQIAILDNNL